MTEYDEEVARDNCWQGDRYSIHHLQGTSNPYPHEYGATIPNFQI